MPPRLVARFADETDVFGLHLFNTHRSRFEVVFWCSFVLIFSCYTAKTLVSIVKTYVDEETVSYVSQKTGTNISFPFAELCFFGDPVVGKLPVDVALKSVFEALKNNSILLNASAFVSAVDFLRQLQLSEKKLSLADAADSASLRVVDPAIATGLRLFSEKGMSLSNVYDFLLLQLCRSITVRIVFNSSTMNTTHVAEELCERGYPTRILYWNAFHFCINIQGSDYVYQVGWDRLNVMINVTTAYEKLGIKPDVIELWLKSPLSQDVNTVDTESMLVIPLGKAQIHKVKINAEHQLLNLRRRRCSEEGPKTVWCKRGCESAFFYTAYGCWPLIYRFQFSPRRQNISNVRPCGADDYLNSRRSASRDARQRGVDCLDECVEPCTQRTYVVTSIDYARLAADAIDANSAMATIFILSFVYTVVEERLANDFESFLSSFGGALGLFLGASFASVVHIPMFLLQAAFGLWRAKQNGNGTNAETAVEMKTADKERTVDEHLRIVDDRLASIEGILLPSKKATEHAVS